MDDNNYKDSHDEEPKVSRRPPVAFFIWLIIFFAIGILFLYSHKRKSYEEWNQTRFTKELENGNIVSMQFTPETEDVYIVEGEYRLVTGSALHHSGTTSTRAKGPLAVVPEAFVEISREDAAELQVAEGDTLKVKGNGVELKLKVKVDLRMPKGLLFAPYHFADAGVNQLYKGETVIPVTVKK